MKTPIVITLLCGFAAAACGGGDSTGGVTTPPPATTGRITIQLTTSAPSISAGAIYGRSGTTSSRRVDFIASDGRCASAPTSNTCTYDVKIGDTVSLAATEPLAEPSIGGYAAVSSPDDPRTIESQFVSWSSPCVS